mgnify:FL=1
MIEFLSEWFRWTVGGLFLLALDNLWWIHKSREWYDYGGWNMRVKKNKEYKDFIWWAFKHRFVHVLTNKIDIAASMVGGLLLTLLL